MASENKLFHESWHRIANQRIALRSSVKIQRQMFRGERWYVLQDSFDFKFYRIRSQMHDFIIRLGTDRTVEEVWKECMDTDPENAPGQGDVIEILAQLYQSNLLHYNLAPDSARLFDRYKKRKQREVKSTLMNIMFARLPLFDPDALLKRLQTVMRWLISPAGALLWVALVGVAIKLVMDNAADLQIQSERVLAPSNLFLLYSGLVLIKALHEFGHAFAVRRFGGEVHTMGIMLMLFSPLPYTDATAAWAFRDKWQRVFVGSAGMIFELAAASIATIVWANTGQGVIHSLAYNMMFVASVSTLLFNINPLLRYDGYYILSDILDVPNLHQQANRHLTYLVERYIFGSTRTETSIRTTAESFWFALFAIASSIYKIIVFTGIVFFVANQFLLLGIVMAVICIITWTIVPAVKLIKYLAASPVLDRTRQRAITLCAGSFLFIVAVLYFCPIPCSFKAPGVLKTKDHIVIVNNAPGVVREVLVAPGSRVEPSMPLVRLENPEINHQIAEAQASLVEGESMYRKAMQEGQADMQPITKRIEATQKRLERLLEDRRSLVVTSPIGGVWVAPEVEQYRSMFANRGTPLGQIIDDRHFLFSSVVAQQDVAQLFSSGSRRAVVRLSGQTDIDIAVKTYTSIPMEHTALPSSALGWAAGGEVAVDMSDETGTKTTEPFYEVQAQLDRTSGALLLYGRAGKIKFVLPWEPLFSQGWRKFRQLIQKRYQI